MIRLRTNLYDSDNNIDNELILRDDLIGYGATMRSFRIGSHVEEVNLPTLKVVVEVKKKLLERQEGEKHLVTPKIPRVDQ